MSLARACHYEHFTVESSQREHLFFFSLQPRFGGSASGFKELQLLLICQSTRLPLFACAFVSTRRSIRPSTLLYVFFGGGLVGGRDRVLHFTPFSTLYIALSQHMRLLRTAECEWESGCERIKICCFIFFLLAYISPVLPARPKHHPRKSS